MSFCAHCAGQRFDRAQVLRTLRATRQKLRWQQGQTKEAFGAADEALAAAIQAVRALEIPHLDYLDDTTGDETIH